MQPRYVLDAVRSYEEVLIFDQETGISYQAKSMSQLNTAIKKLFPRYLPQNTIKRGCFTVVGQDFIDSPNYDHELFKGWYSYCK